MRLIRSVVMKKKVWIINHYASDMFFNKGGRHYWIAEQLKKNGYEPVIFCSNAKHDELSNFVDFDGLYEEIIDENSCVKYVFVKTRLHKGNGFSRMLNMFSFFKNVKKTIRKYSKINGKPDVIIGSSVHPLSCVAGIQLSKKFKCECISEIRDLWPEEIVSYSKKWKDTDLIIRLLYRGERWIYKKSNKIIFLQEGAYDYILEKKWDNVIPREKVFYLNNGIDLTMFNYNKQVYQYVDDDLLNKQYINLVYTGSIRMVNNLGIILDTAKLLIDSNVRFLIWGSGDQVEYLKNRCLVENIGNVIFKGKVEKKYIPSIVSQSSANILHWEMSRDLKYGPSYNKMFEYLASGNPIISTLQTPYSIIKKYGCGVSSDSNTPESIASKIRDFISLNESDISLMKEHSIEAAKHFDFKVLTNELIKIIEKDF